MFKKLKVIYKKLALFDKLLITFAILGITIFAVIFFRKSSYLTVTLRVGQENIYYSYWSPNNADTSGVAPSVDNFFYKGMTEKDGFGRSMAEVLDINSYRLVSSRSTLFLKTRLRTTYSRSNNQYSYKGTPVLVGSKISLYLDNVSVDALVVEIDGMGDSIEKKSLIVEGQIIDQNSTYLGTSGVNAYVADAIHLGDTVKDLQGNTMIKILSKVVKPATKTVATSDGRVLVVQDPLRKDVYLIMEVTADVIQGKYFLFKDVPILINEDIPVCTEVICFYPTIVDIQDARK